MSDERRTVLRSFRASPDEWSTIQERAALARKPPATFVREAALSTQVVTEPRPDGPQDRAIFQLARIGNNLNQLTREANAGRYPSEERLHAVLNEVLDTVRKFR